MSNIPKKIKTDMLFNKLFLIIAGVVGCGALFGLQQFLLDSAQFKNSMETLSLAFIVCYILMAIFLIAYPILLMILRTDEKRIEKDMKRCGFDEKALYIDYSSASKHGKTRIGALCTYSTSFYNYYIIPNSRIVAVGKKIKVRKYKKVVKYNNGAIQREQYNITTREQYFVKITDINGRQVLVSCHKPNTADEIIAFYHRFPHILFGDYSNTSFAKLVKKARKEALNREKGGN
jgi:hypothetical protein